MGLYPRRDLPLLRPCPAASTSCRQSPAGSNVPVASELHMGLGRQETRPWGRLSFPHSSWRSPGKTCVAELCSNARGFREGGRGRSAGQPGATKGQGLAGDCSVQGSRVSV